jgi:hypothetical protein
MTTLFTNFQPVSLTIAEFANFDAIRASVDDLSTPVELRLLDAGQINFDSQLAGLSASILGTIGADRIAAGDGADTISGGGGRDTLFGLLGSDSLLGGLGVDYLFGGSGRDTLDGGEGADELKGSVGDDWYFIDNPDDIVIEALKGKREAAAVQAL